MKKPVLLLLFAFLFCLKINSQITLSHNVGNTPIKTDWESCEEEQYWARVFNLEDFGITTDEQFIIRFGEVAISNAKAGSGIIIAVASVDENFPNSQINQISYNYYLETPEIGDTPQIIKFEFKTPITVQSNIKKILVTVSQPNVLNTNEPPFLIAGTENDNDTSWFMGCRKHYSYIETKDLDNPKPNANFFINVTGEKLNVNNSSTNIFLSQNVGDKVDKTSMFSCTSSYQYWAKKFILKDFGINKNQEFIINKGQVALSGAEWLSSVQFNIYKIDKNFPSSFSESDLIGSSQIKEVPYFSYSGSGWNAKIITVDFDSPITIPTDVEMILVEVHKGIVYGDAEAFIAGTEKDNDFSWYRGCNGDPSGEYRTTENLANQGIPYWSNGINYFITVNGEAKTILPFSITNDNTCVNFSNNFSLTNQSEVKSVVWNFDDTTSGINNSSTNINVNHQFTSSGVYNITAEVVHIDNTTYTITKQVEIFESPIINKNATLTQCDNNDINGFSFFNLNEVKEKIVTSPENYTITFHEEKTQAENGGVSITNITNYQNEQVSSDTIWARVENTNGCYEISEVNLLVSTTQIPLNFSKSFYQCDDGINTSDGIATFDFSSVTNDIINIFPVNQQLDIKYYKNEADALSEENAISNISNYQNIGYPNQQTIYIRVDSKVDNSCLGLGAHISLFVEKVPFANPVNINPECDNDRDGFFAFDTSTIQSTIIGNQTNVSVRYFDENGVELSSPLPNPFITKSQKITARIENTSSQDLDGKCFDETILDFIVNTVPIANSIASQEACDDDFDGIIAFDTSNVESTIIGNQTNLIVKYFDENNNPLPSPLPNPFVTASQTISVRIENPLYDVCYEETSVNFIVREKPFVDIIPEDIICITNNTQLELNVENPNTNFTYTWKDENDRIIGNSASVNVSKGGIYKVFATSAFGCNSDEKEILIKESSISTININDIEVQDDSENNFIKINTENLGLGDYEFRLLDQNFNVLFDYQNEPIFDNLDGGVYNLEINDKNACGAIPFEIALISFPKFFTPNGDGVNDFWQIKGIDKSYYKSGVITIFNRFGKTITSFNISDNGWDGTYNGSQMIANDYWFRVVLIKQNDEIKTRTGNFSLIRK